MKNIELNREPIIRLDSIQLNNKLIVRRLQSGNRVDCKQVLEEFHKASNEVYLETMDNYTVSLIQQTIKPKLASYPDVDWEGIYQITDEYEQNYCEFLTKYYIYQFVFDMKPNEFWRQNLKPKITAGSREISAFVRARFRKNKDKIDCFINTYLDKLMLSKAEI